MLRCIVQARPLKITLHVFPYDDQEEVFDPSGAVLECIEDYRRRNPDKQSTVVDTKLEYLQGCEALHGPSNEKCAVELQRNAKECVADLAKRAQDPAKAATPGDAKLNHPHGITYIQLKVPEKVTPRSNVQSMERDGKAVLLFSCQCSA